MKIQIEQLKGPFKANEQIPLQAARKIFKIAIISKKDHMIKLWQPDKDNTKIEKETLISLGKTGILEFRDAYISNLAFLQDEDEDTYIDYMINK